MDLSPFRLAGLFIAGLRHIYVPAGLVHRGLNRPDLAAGLVRIRGEHLDASGLIQAIEGVGFAASLPKKA
jgi:hypothetical protein